MGYEYVLSNPLKSFSLFGLSSLQLPVKTIQLPVRLLKVPI